MSDLKGDLETLKIDRAEARRRSPWRWPLLLLIPPLLGWLVIYGLRLREALQTAEVSTVRALVLDPATAEAGTGSEVLTASGYVVARRKAVVSAKIQGRLSELRVEEGSRVRRGEVIALLENEDFKAQVRRARAQILRAEADLDEQRRRERLADRLHEEEVASQDELDAARSRVRIGEAALEQANAELAFAQAQLDNTEIRAPFSGTVVRKMAEVGESVAPIPPGVNISTASGAIVALADLATLEVEADVSESNVARLENDQPAEVTVEAFPDRRYRAVLRQIIPTADRTRATVMCKVTILDKDEDLKPEMSARVTFLEPDEKAEPTDTTVAESKPIVTIPREALASRDGRETVFVVRDGRVTRRDVVTGGERRGAVVVESGLEGSETLVSNPASTLKDGDPVRIKE